MNKNSKLIEKKVNYINKYRNTSLIDSIQEDNIELSKSLIEKGAPLDIQDADGKTALMIAIDNKNTEISKLLINKGANINIQDKYGNFALMISTYRNNIEICELLIDKGAFLDNKDVDGRTALMMCCIYKNNIEIFKICELLIEKGASINIQSEDGKTALMYSIGEKYIANNSEYNNKTKYDFSKLLIKLLIKNGALLDIKDKDGNFALMYAIYQNNIEICELLIENKALLDNKDGDGRTALITSIKRNNNIEICKLLIEKGALLDIQDKDRQTALMFAIIENNVEICELLIEKGALLDIQDKSGNFALMYAINMDNTELSKLLIEKGSLLDIKNKNGNFALIFAIKYKNVEICKLLIEKGANIFLKDRIGNTLLSYVQASQSNSNPQNREKCKIIIQLLEENATINSFIKARINNFKKDKIFNDKIIFKYFNDINDYVYNSCKNNNLLISLYPTKRNEELQRFISNTSNSNNLLHKKIRIRYEKEDGINAGGLSKEFFNNLEKQINLKTEYQKKISLKEKEYNSKRKELQQRKGNNSINIKENNSYAVRELKESIKKLSNDISHLQQLLNEYHDYPLEKILKILAISKVNCNPIFYINENLRKLILLEISNQFSKTIEKNLIYNTLNFISEEEPTILKKNRESISLLLNKKKYSNIVSKNEEKRSKPNILEKIEDDYLKVLLKNNNQKIIPFNGNSNSKESIRNSIKMNYLTSNNIKELEKNNSNIIENQEQILNFINIYINDLKIYQDIYDFYLSHFYQKIITLDSFYRNLKFVFIPDTINEDQKEAIKNDLITFFNDLKLTPNELYLFNKAISGAEDKLSKEYTFNIYLNEEDKIPYFHTCYNSVDIYLNSFYRRYKNNKKDFIYILKEATTGFQMA